MQVRTKTQTIRHPETLFKMLSDSIGKLSVKKFSTLQYVDDKTVSFFPAKLKNGQKLYVRVRRVVVR